MQISTSYIIAKYIPKCPYIHTYVPQHSGSPGRDGSDGQSGAPGAPGPPGLPGTAGGSGGGVTYTRWGHTACPGGASLVYEGLAGGSHYNEHGGGANVLCLVKSPQYNPGTTTLDQSLAIIYGTEYELGAGQALNRGLRHNHNVPCAVCHVSTRSSQIMVPGTYKCPSGWTTEYSGWLMAAHHGHKGRNMFTCIDKDAEVVPGQGADNNGNLFYHVEANCGTGFPCPPYDQRREMSCVVCTK